MNRNDNSYLHSKVFKQLFLSYVLIIGVFLAVYIGIYFFTYSSYYEETMHRTMQQEADEWAMVMDRQLLSAQNVCSSVNTSESCRNALHTAYVEKRTIDAMQLYKMLNELTRIKGSASNMNVYGLLLGFQGEHKLFSAGSVVSVDGQVKLLEQSPYIGVTSVSELLGVSCSNLMLNKEYLVYAEHYTAFNYSAMAKGTAAKGAVIVLLEQNSLHAMTRSALADTKGYSILNGGMPLIESGERTDLVFTADSLVSDRLQYCIYADPALMRVPVSMTVLLPVAVLVLLSLAFMVISYEMSKRYYRPIDNIGQMLPVRSGRNEMDGILEGIRGLIGEQNGFRERMVTITPYARQGMLHSLISGNVNPQQLEVFTNEQFMDLRKAYFMLAVVNVAGSDFTPQQYQDALDLMTHACHELSTEEFTVACCPKNQQNLFVVVGSDNDRGMEDLFYQLYRKIEEVLDDGRYAVTIGVSGLQVDLESLGDACAEAEKALRKMLTGGRRSVYFHDTLPEDAERPYFFPKDAQKHMIRCLKEADLPALHAMLDEIYRRNVQEADLSAKELRTMLDELHLTILSALRAMYDLSTTHIQIDRIRDAATIEEIIEYYRGVFTTALQTQDAMPPTVDSHALEKDVCAYIDQNICNPDISLNGIADRFGVSTKMIGALCKNVYGKTFLQHVRDQQIHHAASLLESTDASLEEIAQQCGFSNLLTFRRNFKAVMGMNPSDFRK